MSETNHAGGASVAHVLSKSTRFIGSKTGIKFSRVDPNGVVSAASGSICIQTLDDGTWAIWIRDDGTNPDTGPWITLAEYIATQSGGNPDVVELAAADVLERVSNRKLVTVGSGAGAFTVSLYSGDSTVPVVDGDEVVILDAEGACTDEPVTVDVEGGGTINGAASVALDVNRAATLLRWSDASDEWLVVSEWPPRSARSLSTPTNTAEVYVDIGSGPGLVATFNHNRLTIRSDVFGADATLESLGDLKLRVSGVDVARLSTVIGLALDGDRRVSAGKFYGYFNGGSYPLITPDSYVGATRVDFGDTSGGLATRVDGTTVELATSGAVRMKATGSEVTLTVPLALNTAAGPNITAGAGAPAVNHPRGSLYLRTDGGVGSTIYYKRGALVGDWTAIA